MLDRSYKKQTANYEFIEQLLENFSLSDLQTIYTNLIMPSVLTVSIVGSVDFASELKNPLEQTLGKLRMPFHPKPHLSKLSTHYLDRDQVLIRMGGASINKFDGRLDAIELYNEHLTDRLFNLREETGLFYSIHGTMLANMSTHTPGNWYVEALVSPENVCKACALILNFVESDSTMFDEQKLEIARYSIIRSYKDLYTSNSQIASTFIFADTNRRGFDMTEKRPAMLNKVTVKHIQDAASSILHRDNISLAIVGRIGERDVCKETTLLPWENLQNTPLNQFFDKIN